MSEKRAAPRIKIHHKVGVRLSAGGIVYVTTSDLGVGGMQLLSEYPADVGDTLSVFFTVLDPQSDTFVAVDARVKVVHSVYDGAERCFRVGVEFSQFEGEGEAVYRRFFDARLYKRFGQHLGL